MRLGTPLNTYGVPFSCTCLVHRWWSSDGLMNCVADRIATSESIAYTCSQGRPRHVFDPLVAHPSSDVQPLVRRSVGGVICELRGIVRGSAWTKSTLSAQQVPHVDQLRIKKSTLSAHQVPCADQLRIKKSTLSAHQVPCADHLRTKNPR